MNYKKIIPYINGENELSANIISKVETYALEGADEVFVYNYAKDEKSREEFLATAKEIAKTIDVPFYIGMYIERFEDVKKAFYTGASYVVIKHEILKDDNVLKESAERFGKDKIILEIDAKGDFQDVSMLEQWKNIGIFAILLKHITISPRFMEYVNTSALPIIIRDSFVRNDLSEMMSLKTIIGVSTNALENKDIMKAKIALKKEGISVNVFESVLDFSDFKLNGDGLIPVVTQDYKTNEVLMVAYMNEESFKHTLATGKMTYFSRSRQELWCKGDTSGHYQYVKSLFIDCDQDTLLAKVRQVGVACHTGNLSCFFTELVKREYDDTNPLTVFNQVYDVIMDRKNNPKEGSYTNYLFEKGIDKILKKCGEEATEIVIAAKNPDAEELKYEIADFLYHVMVLMAECNLDWDDVVKELAHRR